MSGTIVVFGGTTEGRILCKYLSKKKINTIVFVATEYGREVLEPNPYLSIQVGRLNRLEMERELKQKKPVVVIDATHPYAVEVTENIKNACQNQHSKYIRLKREESCLTESDSTVIVPSAKAAAHWLKDKTGNILLTIGSKEMEEFLILPNFSNRVYARILPMAVMMAKWEERGLTGRHLIGMQGPFSERMNQVMIEELEIQYLVTKESGKTGGFVEKRDAAKKTGCQLIVIQRPQKEDGISMEQLIEKLEEGTL